MSEERKGMPQKRYKVPVEIVFVGEITVVADNRVQARKLVAENFWALLDMCGANKRAEIEDWDINTHADRIMFNKITRL